MSACYTICSSCDHRFCEFCVCGNKYNKKKKEEFMSKSFDFCKTVAQDPLRSTYTDRSWDNAVEYNKTEAIFDEFLHGARNFLFNGKVDDETEICFDVGISFDGNADFDYFTAEGCIHDGTLYFIREAMNRCVQKVCLAQTYNKNIRVPESGDSVQYIVGNFVVLTEYDGDFVPADKPFLRTRTTVLLPLKMRVLRSANDE